MRTFLLLILLALPCATNAQNPDYPPIKGFVSIEPFSLREEMVIRLDVVEAWLGIETPAGIKPDRAKEITDALSKWLAGKNTITVEGLPISTTLDQIHFVRPDPEKGLVVDKRDLIPSATALIGTVAGASLDGLPTKASVTWGAFPENIDPPIATVEIGTRKDRRARELRPGNATIDWEGGEGEEVPTFLEVPGVERVSTAAWIYVLCFVLAVVAATVKQRVLRFAILIGAAFLFAQFSIFREKIQVTQPDADEIAYTLLRNTYHAFDFRDESTIYDALDRSISGDLLEQVYLEVTKSLQLESQGGARVRIIDLDLRDTTLGEVRGDDFDVLLKWVAIGEITHWGHTHKRVNQYTADATVQWDEGPWKFTALTLANEERL